jgi:hypothetical protein
MKSFHDTTLQLSTVARAHLDPYKDWLFIFDTDSLSESFTDVDGVTFTTTYYNQRLYRFDLSTNAGSILTPV